MMKKIISIMVVISMICACLGFNVFASSIELDYEPTEFTYTYGGNNNGGYKLAWKNPSASTLQRVTVYSIDEDNASQVVESPTPGAISMVTVFSGNTSRNGNYDEFRLVFEFTDGETREVYYTGRGVKDNALTNGISSAAGLSFGNKWSANTANTRVNVNIQNKEAVNSNALQVISNRTDSPDVNYQTNEYSIFFDGGMYQKLQSGVSYKISMKVKAEKNVSFGIRTRYTNDDITTISVTGDSDWQDIEKTFIANTNQYLSLGFGTLASCVYIDNVEVTRVSDNAVMVSQDFEGVSATYSAPTDIVAEGGDKSATFTWTAPTDDTKFINVYEKLSDGTLVRRARTKHTATGITLSNLKAGTQYTFVVTGSSLMGLETDKNSNVYTVSTSEVEIPAEEVNLDYEPTEFTYTYGGNNNGGYKLAWKNPTESTLQRVTVYSIDEDNASQVVESPTPGAISVVNAFSGNTSRTGNYDEFRLVFEFTDGETREVYYTGREVKDNALTNGISSAAGLSFGNKWSANSANTRVNVNIQNKEAVNSNALQVISNRTDSPDVNYQTNEYSIFFDGGIYQKLQSGVSYKISMKVKAEKNVSFGIRTRYTNDDITTISVTGDSDWQDIEQTFTANTNEYLSLGFGTLASCVYIDNVEVTRVSDNAVMVSQDFEGVSATYSAPTNISATGGNKSVTFTWTAPSDDTRFINVYEKMSDGTLVLRAKTKHTNTGITLSNLESETQYTFVVTGSALIGLETDKNANEFIVSTTEAYVPNYEVKTLQLLNGSVEAGQLTDGTYSSKAVIVNNKMGDEFTAQLIVAIYDGDELSNCYVSELTDIPQNSQPIPLNINNISVTDVATTERVVKVMLWTGLDDIVPLCESARYAE